MSGEYCDGKYTFTEKPTTSPSITAKGTRPSTTITPTPCIEELAILAEDSEELLYESSIVMTVQGAL